MAGRKKSEVQESPRKPQPPIDLDQSVAGEEDPGASLDVSIGDTRPVPAPPAGERNDAQRPQGGGVRKPKGG